MLDEIKGSHNTPRMAHGALTLQIHTAAFVSSGHANLWQQTAHLEHAARTPLRAETIRLGDREEMFFVFIGMRVQFYEALRCSAHF